MPKIILGKKKRTMKIRVKPKRSRPARLAAIAFGRTPNKTLKPSRGGIGKRLKRAKPRFRTTAVLKISFGNARNNNANTTEMKMLVRGPARAVRAMSFFGSRKLNGSMGIGLAAPKITPAPVRNKISGKPMVIIGSMWGMGFSVKRRERRAVGSPSRSAAQPWAISCKMTE